MTHSDGKWEFVVWGLGVVLVAAMVGTLIVTVVDWMVSPEGLACRIGEVPCG